MSVKMLMPQGFAQSVIWCIVMIVILLDIKKGHSKNTIECLSVTDVKEREQKSNVQTVHSVCAVLTWPIRLLSVFAHLCITLCQSIWLHSWSKKGFS